MIVYSLHCAHGHGFEGWFSSPGEFERQRVAGQLACPMCDGHDVQRLPSAPYVNVGALPARRLDAPTPEGLRELKAFLLKNTQDVGRKFPEVARRMHYGEEALRAIRGQVSPEEAEELREEGVPAQRLPPGLVLGEEVH
jgi:hypothetical protein